MKVKSIIRKADYIRFCFEVKVQVNKGLVIETSLMGDYTQGEGVFSDYNFISVDDIDWREITLFGEKVKFEGLKELYSKLFKKTFETLEEEVDDFATKAVDSAIHGNAGALPKIKLIKLLRSFIYDGDGVEKVDCITKSGYKTEVIGGWQVTAAMRLLGNKPTSYKRLIALEYSKSIWGFTTEDLYSALGIH